MNPEAPPFQYVPINLRLDDDDDDSKMLTMREPTVRLRQPPVRAERPPLRHDLAEFLPSPYQTLGSDSHEDIHFPSPFAAALRRHDEYVPALHDEVWLPSTDVSPQQLRQEASQRLRSSTDCDPDCFEQGALVTRVTLSVPETSVDDVDQIAESVAGPLHDVCTARRGVVRQVVPSDEESRAIVEVTLQLINDDGISDGRIATTVLPLVCAPLQRLTSSSGGALFGLTLQYDDVETQQRAFVECILWLLIQKVPETDPPVAVYGGAIRDYVLRGVGDITDIDVCIPDDMPKDWTYQQLKLAIDSTPVRGRVRLALLPAKPGVHERFTATLFRRECSSGNSPTDHAVHTVEVECVAVNAFRVQGADRWGRHIDCSFNNVALDRRGLRPRHAGEGPRFLCCINDAINGSGTAVRSARSISDEGYLSRRYLNRIQHPEDRRRFQIENVGWKKLCSCAVWPCACTDVNRMVQVAEWNQCLKYHNVNVFTFRCI